MSVRGGMSILEVVIACVIMAVLSIPLLELFQGGVRATRATIHEVIGTNLGAELAEQVACVPFPVLEKLCATGPRTFSSEKGELVDGQVLDEDAHVYFHTSTLPGSFRRTLTLELTEPDLVRVDVEIAWSVGKRERSVALRRVVIRDELLPR